MPSCCGTGCRRGPMLASCSLPPPCSALAPWCSSASFYLSLYFLHRPDPNHLGFGYVIAVFGAIWVGDTAAMVAGLSFVRHQFFSRISPKKTVEGAIAELLASTVFFAIFGLLLNIGFPHNV